MNQSNFEHAVVALIIQAIVWMLTGEGGVSYPEMAPIDGFHVNLACESLPDNVKPFIVTPKTPIRVFA